VILIPAFFQAHKWPLLAAAAVSVLGFFPLMGLPGAGLMAVFDAVANVLHQRAPSHPTHYGDAHWPIALCYSIAAPWILFGVYLALKAVGVNGWHNAAATAAAAFVGLAAFHALAIYPAAASRATAQAALAASPEARLKDLEQALLRLSQSDSDYYLSNLQLQEPGKQTVGAELFAVLERIKKDAAGPQLSPAQLSSLEELAGKLRAIEANPSLQQEEATRSSPEWLEVRRRSEELLASLPAVRR
jgi:hypothetical protein